MIGYAASVTGFHDIDVAGRQIRHPRAVVRSMSLALGLSLTGALVVTALGDWMDPGRLALWSGAAVFFVAGFSGLLMATFSRKSAMRSAISGGLLGAACTIGAPIVAVGWAQPTVRSSVLEGWSGGSMVFRVALDDPSDLVATASCREILARRDQGGRERLLPTLTVRARVAAECLTDDNGWATDLAPTLAHRWSKELEAAADPSDDGTRAVELAGALSALPLPQRDRDDRLLACAFGSSNPASREQCATTLTVSIPKDQWMTRLSSLSQGSVDPRSATGIAAMAFHQTGLEPAQKRLAQHLSASELPEMWAALGFTQSAIEQGAMDPIRELIASLEGVCDLDVTAITRNRDTWFSLAGETVARQKPKSDPRKVLCTVATEQLASFAVEDAIALVHASIRPPSRAAARGIDKGWLMNNPFASQTTEDFNRMIPAGVSEEERKALMEHYSRQPLHQANPMGHVDY